MFNVETSQDMILSIVAIAAIIGYLLRYSYYLGWKACEKQKEKDNE